MLNPPKEFPNPSWQELFAEQYVQDRPAKSFLMTRPGEGKTHAALKAWQHLQQDQKFENIIVITPSLALKEHWQDLLLRQTSLAHRIVPTHMTVQNIQRLRGDLVEELDNLYHKGKTFVVVDDAHYLANNSVLKKYFLPGKIVHAAPSQILYLSSVGAEQQVDLLNQLATNTTYVYDPAMLKRGPLKKELARLSPSYEILQRFWKQGLTLDGITWRQFEKLVRELLEADGYTVELMNGTKDGGVDVVAVKNGEIAGFFKTVWQAKKFSRNKVGLHFIRELADSVQEFKASKGIIVTTSFLTADALFRVQRDQYTLGKVDRTDLEAWINRILYK